MSESLESSAAASQEANGSSGDDRADMNQAKMDRAPTGRARTGRAPAWADGWGHVVFWSLAVLGLAADLWTKSAVHGWLETLPGRTHVVIPDYVALVMRFNRGAAFSMFQGRTALLLAVSVVALAVVLGVFVLGSGRHRLTQVALGLLTAGILGNLYDRLFNDGTVRDWIEVVIPVVNYRWPAFNIADSLLCTAVGLIVLMNLFGPRKTS